VANPPEPIASAHIPPEHSPLEQGEPWKWTARACPLCRRDESREILPSTIDPAKLDGFAFASRKLPEYMHLRMVECVHCGILYGNPALSWSIVSQGYQEASFDSQEESAFAAVTYREILHRYLPNLPRASALDIGAGDGAFLEQLLAEGFQDVRGVEPSAAPIAAAKPDIRPRIHRGFFQPDDYSPNTFDLVTCLQVMEHVWDPLETARNAFGILKPGGAFLVAVHNRRALSARVLGARSPIFDIEHLQLFSPPTISALLESAGFTNVRALDVGNRYPLQYWLRLAPLPFKKALIAAVRRTGLGKIPLTIRAGNTVAFGFKPGPKLI
jgi:SAM-dependent methyltransferase